MLKISKNSGLTDIVSDDGTNPLSSQHPITGTAVSTRVWLFNDDNTKRYEAITIDPTDASAPDNSTWIQLAPDNAGSPGAYLAGGAALTMANISDVTGHPFWVRVTTPSVADSQNVTDIKLTVKANEFAV
jgi:hypothetical protein